MSHTTDPVVEIVSPTPTEVVDDFLIVEQEPQDRPAVYASGDLYTSYTTTRESGGDFNFFDFFLPVNGGPPPHYHPFEHEIWYVTTGEFQFNLGDRGTNSLVVPEGTTVFSPRDRTHGYRNLDSTASLSGVTPGARTLSMTTRGALDLFFDAAATRVVDRNEPIPSVPDPTPQDFTNLVKFAARTNAGIVLTALDPEYQAPEDALDYVLVLPEDADTEVAEEARALAELDGFSVWTTGEHAGLPQRPTFTGEFGLEYTSLVSLEESGGEFSYNQFSLEPHNFDADNFPESVVSEEHELFYVNEGQLSLQIGDEQVTVQQDTYVYIAPGNEYVIANFGDETIEALSISVTDTEQTNMEDNLTLSSVNAQGSVEPNRFVYLGDGDDFFNESTNPNSYRYIYDVAPGFTDFTLALITVDGVTYDGTFVAATINPATQELDFVNGVFNVIEGSLGDPNSTVEILREDYSVAGRDGVITLKFFDSPQDLSTVPDEIAELPADTQEGLSPDTIVTLPFGVLIEQYDSLVIPAEEFAFPEFRDSAGNPAPIVGEGVSVQAFESRRRVYGGAGDDELYAIKEDRMFGEEGNDFLDASNGFGTNHLDGGEGNDEIYVNVDDRAFGGEGNDLLDASVGAGQPGVEEFGNNFLDGGNGNDTLIADSKSQLNGGNGQDTLIIRQGGNNLLSGGFDADQFWIVNGELPDAVAVEYPEDATSLLPEGVLLPELVDTKNIIADFELGIDRIYISGIEDIASSFDDLELLPSFGTLDSTDIIATFTQEGVEKEISLATVSGIYFNELSTHDFVFA